MSVFLRRFINNKKYILLFISIVFIIGFIFGFIIYNLCNQSIKDCFEHVFYLNNKLYTNYYQMYLIQNALFILINTYLSTSYYGWIGILFVVFIKAVSLSFSIIFVFTQLEISFIILLILLIEFLVEILFLSSISIMTIYLSLYATLVSFCLEENFNIKSILNYSLNYLIISLIIFSLSLALRLYLIPLF